MSVIRAVAQAVAGGGGGVSVESGTWTPTLTTTGTDFDSVTYDTTVPRLGNYTRIGNRVFFDGQFRTDAVTIGSATGSVLISGLPFTIATGKVGPSCAVGYSGAWSGVSVVGAFGSPGTSYVNLYKQASSGADFQSLSASTDVATGADANFINISGNYFTDE